MNDTPLCGAIEMSNTAYHKAPGVSASKLKLFARSPRHYLQSVLSDSNQQTEAMLLGSVTHTMILEPHLLDTEYTAEPACDKRTTKGKEIAAEWASNKCESATVVKNEIYTHAKSMADAVAKDEWAAATLLTGKTEESLFWIDPVTGLACKCRPDRYRDDLGIVVDVKTTIDASPAAFQRLSWGGLYHLQAAFYMEGIFQVTGVMPRAFILLAIEKEAPYVCVPYLIDEELLQRGRDQYRELLNKLAECEATDIWPGYTDRETGILPLSAPRWA